MRNRRVFKMVVPGGFALLGCGGLQAAVIDINGYLATSTATDGEWGDNSGRPDSPNTTGTPIGSNRPPAVSDFDGTATLTVSANIQDWRIQYSSGSYTVGEEWNVRSSSTATTAAGAFTQGAYFSITLNSAGAISWDSVSASFWRNGSGADTTFQLAVDANGDGFDTGDLVGTAATPSGGIGGDTTLTFNGPSLADESEVRLYHWGNSSPSGNMHLYDVAASYTVIPEPSAGLLLCLASSVILRRRR